ncbi:MAG TPA: transketolase C-terminal domain-containing protein [Acidimicrobiales bacterium]|nr:transketolase C-terminal domain-containing protein [Acidimicrobiales bacterium]
MVSLSPMRKTYGESLVELGRQRSDVVVLTADVQTSDFSYMFAEAFPERFFNVGIAEQCLVDVAVGLSYGGLLPFVNTFAVFLASRALEPVLTHLCYGRANVKLMAGFSGISPQMDGPTHHAITDIAVMRSLPGMTVVSPADPVAMQALLPQVAAWPGPVYYRFCRNDVPVVFHEEYAPEIGRAHLVRDGGDVTLIGVGTLLARCLEAANLLSEEGIEARVLDMHTIKPLDTGAVLAAAQETRALITAEEHSIIGGLGGAVAEVIAEAGLAVPLRRIGLADTFAESGGYYEMLDKYGMSARDIAMAAEGALARPVSASALARGEQ